MEQRSRSGKQALVIRLPPGRGPSREGQPLAARESQRKPAEVISRRVRSIQRAAQRRQQSRRDSR
jgi:hypothetical protein